jgi:transposase
VLKMVDVEYIKKRHALDGWSIRKIARQLELSRQTVRKAIAAAAEPPRYHLRQPRPAPVIGPYLGLIESWLTADESAPPKQRHTAKRVYDRLVSEYGYSGSEMTVRRAVRAHRGRRTQVFVPLEAVPGKVAQADFGVAQVMIAGRSQRVFLFCLRARASKVPFACAYPTEKLEAFLAGHVAAFAFFGGVFREVWYDNPKTAVTKILAGLERREQEDFSRLRAHYLFDSHFCTPGEAHEKGAVEHLVGYVRRNALVPADRPFESLEELNAHLLAWCERERERHKEEWRQENTALRPLPAHHFRASLSRPALVGKTSLVRLDHNRYSVPVRYCGEVLRAELSVEQVELYRGEILVASHRRTYARGESILELSHYLPAFRQKPRAAGTCAALHQADPVFLTVRDRLLAEPRGHRRFAEILLLGTRFPLSVLADALRETLKGGLLLPEVVQQHCLNATHQLPAPAPVPAVLRLSLPRPDLSRYDTLVAAVAR